MRCRPAQIIAGYIRYKNSTNCLLKSTLGYAVAALCYFVLGCAGKPREDMPIAWRCGATLRCRGSGCRLSAPSRRN
jgi:hypothetical protein